MEYASWEIKRSHDKELLLFPKLPVGWPQTLRLSRSHFDIVCSFYKFIINEIIKKNSYDILLAVAALACVQSSLYT